MTSRTLRIAYALGPVVAFVAGVSWVPTACANELTVEHPCRLDAEPLAACVNGTAITLKEVDDRAGKLFVRSGGTLDEVIFDSRQAIVEAVVADLLIKDEAARTHSTPEELLAPYLAMKSMIETDAFALPSAWTAEREQLTRLRAFVASLRDRASIDIYLRPPRSVVPIGIDSPAVGVEEAPLQLIVFADFECPYCARLVPVLNGLRSRFNDDIRVVHKDFPLTAIHQHAQIAAEAARCAGDQDDYWVYHDLLFSRPAAPEEDTLVEYARELNLDEEAFAACLRSHRFAPAVQKDARDARALGLDSTPVSFLNGRKILGALDLDAFTRIAEQELERLRHTQWPQER